MTEQKNNFQHLLARAIVRKLWFENYISEEEMKGIDERNKISFGYIESTDTENKTA